MMKKISADNILFLVLMATLPTILVMLISFVFLLLPGEKNEIVQSIVVLPISFVMIPSIILFRQEKIDLTKLGIKKFNKKDVLVFTICLITLYAYLFLNFEASMILVLSIQTLIVAISEEFWARGILFYVLRKIFDNYGIVILLSSVIFAFITHMNRDVIENLLYRMPGALAMGVIYYKTGKLQYSILFHYIYNILGSL